MSKNNTPDENALAEIVIKNTGKENLFYADSHVWYWSSQNVWEKMDTIQLKKIILNVIKTQECRRSNRLLVGIKNLIPLHIDNKSLSCLRKKLVINFKNGELIWINDKWVLKAPDKNNLSLIQIPHNYEENNECPKFERFLASIFERDTDAEDKRELIFKMIGYCLTTSTKFDKFFILYGQGANGKSVLMKIMEEIVGKKNTVAVQPSDFNRTFQRAHLQNKLINLVTELPQGKKLPDAELKSIVSGETLTVEHKNKDPFEFRPFAKCIFGTNHLPHINDYSNATYRRAIIITFNRTFTLGKNANPNLAEELIEEITGIIKKSLYYLGIAIQKNNIKEPESSRKIKEEWRRETDQIKRFIEDCLEKDLFEKISTNTLYEEYRHWATTEGIRQVFGKNQFSNAMVSNGATRTKGTNGARCLQGYKIKSSG